MCDRGARDAQVVCAELDAAQLQLRRAGLSGLRRAHALDCLIEQATVIQRILRRLGLPTEIP
jgi:hypothetical protein